MTCLTLSLTRERKAAFTIAMLAFVLGLSEGGVRSYGADDNPKPAGAAKEQRKPLRLVGIVQDSDGNAVPDATVILENVSDRNKAFKVQSQQDGRFAFDSLPWRREHFSALRLVAGKKGLAPAMFLAVLDKEPGRSPEIVLTLFKGGTFAGTVRDRAGAPLEGARVQWGIVEHWKADNMHGFRWYHVDPQLLHDTPLETIFVNRTDAKGRFQFPSTPIGQNLFFQVEATGFASLDTRTITEKGYPVMPSGTTPLELTLVPEARVHGRVVSRVPRVKVNGLHIWLQAVEPRSLFLTNGRTSTDQEGRFTLRGLPEGAFNVHMDQPPQAAAWAVRSAPKVTPRPGAIIDLEIELIEGVVVQGKVVAADTKKPIPGATVALYGPARPKTSAAVYGTQTDKEGRYRFRLAPGETEFYLMGPPAGFMLPPGGSERIRVLIPSGVKNIAGPTFTVRPAATPEGES